MVITANMIFYGLGFIIFLLMAKVTYTEFMITKICDEMNKAIERHEKEKKALKESVNNWKIKFMVNEILSSTNTEALIHAINSSEAMTHSFILFRTFLQDAIDAAIAEGNYERFRPEIEYCIKFLNENTNNDLLVNAGVYKSIRNELLRKNIHSDD